MYAQFYCVDGHADILDRLWTSGTAFDDPDSPLQASWHRLREGGVDLQSYSLFVDPAMPAAQQLTRILQYIERYESRVAQGRLVRVLSKRSLNHAVTHGLPAGILAMEGAEALQGDVQLLRLLYRLGVRMAGLTWNYANCIADGVGEVRGAGLTAFGRDVVLEMGRLGMVVDVSHLSERGFWDVETCVQGPFVASHANCYEVLAHRRNLRDDQIRAIASHDGLIGLTFVPYFITNETADIDALFRHLDHLLSLVGERHIGFGSDFDGIETTMIDLTDSSKYVVLYEAIERRYGASVLQAVAGGNWIRVFDSVLAEDDLRVPL